VAFLQYETSADRDRKTPDGKSKPPLASLLSGQNPVTANSKLLQKHTLPLPYRYHRVMKRCGNAYFSPGAGADFS
jgi:hypothetical protein